LIRKAWSRHINDFETWIKGRPVKTFKRNKLIVPVVASVIALAFYGVTRYSVFAATAAAPEIKNLKATVAAKALNNPGSDTILSAGSSSQPFSQPMQTTRQMSEAVELAPEFVPASATGQTENSPFSAIALPGLSSGQNAIANLNGHLNAVAAWYGMSSAELRQLFLSDGSVHIDSKGRILHIDAGVSLATPDVAMATATTSTGTVEKVGSASPFSFDQTFKLHSKPDSSQVLYLNFIGQGSHPAFDTDKLPGTFNNDERLIIQKVLLRVAEAYSAFDVDVTTEPPSVPAGKKGVTILITPQANSIGGYAYLNSFSAFAPGSATAFCFPNNLRNAEKYIADCVSHEGGHTVGLWHQGQLPSTAYYSGQGTGETSWAPIMGVGYYKSLTQWAKGEYFHANNNQDAYATMLRQGLAPRIDDHGDSIPFADPLTSTITNGYNNITGAGIIKSPSSIDMFQFFAGAGPVNLSVTGATLGSTLDAALQLFDVHGNVLGKSSTTATTLSKKISAILPSQGTYYLSVAGQGRGDPLTTGYTKYGSIGQYSISGTAAQATGQPSVLVINTSVSTGKALASIVFDASKSIPATGHTVASFIWAFGDATAVAATPVASHAYKNPGTYKVTLTMLDSAGMMTTKGIVITIK
jgi:hypothetical protein